VTVDSSPTSNRRDDDAEARENLEEHVVLQRLEAVIAEEAEVPEHDAADQLAQDGRLARARRQPPSNFPAPRTSGETEEERDDRSSGPPPSG